MKSEKTPLPKAEKPRIETKEAAPDAIEQRAGELLAREAGLVDKLPEDRAKGLMESGLFQRWAGGMALATVMAGMLGSAPSAEAGQHRRYVGHSRGRGIERVYNGIEDSKQDEKEAQLDQYEEQLDKLESEYERLENQSERAQLNLQNAKRKVTYDLQELKRLQDAVDEFDGKMRVNKVRQQVTGEKIAEIERSLRGQQMRRSIIRGVLEEVRGSRY